LGPLILQLSENFSPKLFPNLKAYLPGLPRTIPVHLEVRNKTGSATRKAGTTILIFFGNWEIGTVISDTAGRRDAVHMELTTSQALIRFVGNNLAASDYIRMDA
jgi:hypothetical protein